MILLRLCYVWILGVFFPRGRQARLSVPAHLRRGSQMPPPLGLSPNDEIWITSISGWPSPCGYPGETCPCSGDPSPEPRLPYRCSSGESFWSWASSFSCQSWAGLCLLLSWDTVGDRVSLPYLVFNNVGHKVKCFYQKKTRPGNPEPLIGWWGPSRGPRCWMKAGLTSP